MVELGASQPTKSIAITACLEITPWLICFPMLSVAQISKAMKINRTLMQHYINGRKRPSTKRAAEIEAYIHTLGMELTKIHL